MALSWAQSKVERFQDNAIGSSVGPGDYDPCVPKSHGMVGAVSLGFTSTKGLTPAVRTESISEESASTGAAARDRSFGTSAASRRASVGGARPTPTTGLSRLEKIKMEQQTKQLARAEMEKEKLQAEIKNLKSLQETVVKSERQARAESSNASKRADAIERKAANVIAHAGLIEEAETEASRLAGEVAAVVLATEKAEATHGTLQQRRAELESKVVTLEERIEWLTRAQSKLVVEADEAKRREEELGGTVASLRAANRTSEARLRDARASAEASAAAVESATERERLVRDEFVALTNRASALEEASARLETELDGCKGSLHESELRNTDLLGEMAEIRDERDRLVAGARSLEGELADAKVALDRAAADAESRTQELLEVEADRDQLRENLGRVESELAASSSETSALEQAALEERAEREALKKELGSTKEALAIAESRAARLDQQLEASNSIEEASRLASQLTEVRGRVETLEKAVAESVENADGLRQRLGDALAESVEYADQHTRAEERLRVITLDFKNSEADCAALWEEREEAKERLCAAFFQGRQLEEKLACSMAETLQLRGALEDTEARLTSAAKELGDVREELGASRGEMSAMRMELEKMNDKFAAASPEARALRGDAKAEISCLETKLSDMKSRLDASAEEQRRLRARLASTEAQRDAVTVELAQVQKVVDTGANDFVALEAKLSEAESTCERLRAGVEMTEREMSELSAQFAIEREQAERELEDALVKSTGLQEELSSAQGLLTDAAEERRELEARLYESSTKDTVLQKAAHDSALAAAAASANLEGQRVKVASLESEIKALRAAVVEKQASLEEAGRAAAAHRAAQRGAAEHQEAESCKLRAILGDIDADRTTSQRTAEELRLELGNTHGVGAEVGEKLILVVQERNEARGKLEVAESSLAASKANGRRLQRELLASQALARELREETEGWRRNLDELQKEFEGLGEAKEVLSTNLRVAFGDSWEEESNADARIRLLGEASSREVSMANEEAWRARCYLEAASAKLSELRTLNEDVCQVQAEGGAAIREVELANPYLQRLTSENPALAGHKDTKQNIKHLQDLKNHNTRLQSEKARQASELALAVAVLEVVGVLPKLKVDAASALNPEGAAGMPLHSAKPVGGANNNSDSLSAAARETKGSAKEGAIAAAAATNPRSKSHLSRVSLESRLLEALDSAERWSPQEQRRLQQEGHGAPSKVTRPGERGRAQNRQPQQQQQQQPAGRGESTSCLSPPSSIGAGGSSSEVMDPAAEDDDGDDTATELPTDAMAAGEETQDTAYVGGGHQGGGGRGREAREEQGQGPQLLVSRGASTSGDDARSRAVLSDPRLRNDVRKAILNRATFY